MKQETNVKHDLRINGEIVETTTSGYHLASIFEVFNKLREKHMEACKKALDKYFGENTECGKLLLKLQEISKKKPEEQTEEDKAVAVKFAELRDKEQIKYLKDPETPTVVSEMTGPNGEKSEIFNADLASLVTATHAALLDRRGVMVEISRKIFELTRRSNLKLAAIALKFEPEEGEKSSSVMTFASSFQEITAQDVDVLDGALHQIHDRTLDDLCKNIGIERKGNLIIP